MKNSSLKYKRDVLSPECTETIYFVDFEGDKFNSFIELRQSLQTNKIHLISKMLGNFSFFVAFVGSFSELENWISENEENLHDIENGYLSIDLECKNISDLKKHLRSI